MTSSAQVRPMAVATIGVFDGVHLGHQALIGQVVERATLLGAQSVCVTFSPHPDDVLRPPGQIAHLTALRDRLELIRRLGIAEIVVMEFTRALAGLTPEEFMDLLLRRFTLKELWVGSDFALGRGRAGNPERLAAIGRQHGFTVSQVPPVTLGGLKVSSTVIRLLLAEGQVEEAARLLDRPYRLRGRVVSGDTRGRTLGFATANLELEERLCVPGDGVYAVRCLIGESRSSPAVANIGVRPTFGGDARLIEAHLIGFDGDLYGQELALDFVARLRDERRFDSPEALVAQIKEDVGQALEVIPEPLGKAKRLAARRTRR